MAEMLKRQYDLLTLKIGLDTAGRTTLVKCELEGRLGKRFDRIDAWEFSAAEMGLPERLELRRTLYHGYEFRLPDGLLEGLRSRIAAVNPDGPDRRPLWLHLAKPYGYLGMVPWERMMQPALDLSMLRLPDFLASPPQETPSVLDVVLCSSLPAAKESFMVLDHVTQMVQRILAAVPRRTTIHVFSDREWHSRLENRLSAMGVLEGPVRLHDPRKAAEYAAPEASLQISDRPGRIDNPWLLWIRDALENRSIDIAHFICHGYLSRDRGALAFSESPVRNEDRRMARFVGAAEIDAFLTQTGAWSAAFSSPENNYSQMGLRQLADTIAQMRPGPVVHHEIPLDGDGGAIAGIYRFLFGPPNEPPPASPALFTYCHPSRLTAEPKARGVARYTFRKASPPPDDEATHPLLAPIFESEENVPAWIAASERFVEQQNLEIRKMTEASGARQGRAAEGLKQTLRQIQEVIANVADTVRWGGKP